MREHCSKDCKFRPCLDKESTNSACMGTIVTAALQRQYSQSELIFWITLVCELVLFANVPQQMHRNKIYCTVKTAATMGRRFKLDVTRNTIITVTSQHFGCQWHWQRLQENQQSAGWV